ncbi:MAG TPA: YegS/Rv2252/BmrU family lipid kinase [Polyangia bacterium]|jgi:YegS/Rv2252/BmrU family lipid kinase|nr:YegS/Rv2252/BmrU family lipid kinase [Polyangia bacterium]
MSKDAPIAVIAHSEKKLDGGLNELRRVLAAQGHAAPLWYEVSSSRKAPKAVRRAVKKGARLVFVWGGDGMVQRCIDALAGTKGVELAILPAGTANLFATNLGIPKDLEAAVRIGLRGKRKQLDVGVMNGERFAVMAGTGFDALTMRDVGSTAKERLGALAYFRSGIKAMGARSTKMTVAVDGEVWFKGNATAVLIGNVGTVTGGLAVFPKASPADGLLEIGVVTADNAIQWMRVFARVADGHPGRSPFVQMTRGKKIVVALARKLPYELDGGARPPTKKLKVRVKASAVTMCVPAARAAARPRATPVRARPRAESRVAAMAPEPVAQPA